MSVRKSPARSEERMMMMTARGAMMRFDGGGMVDNFRPRNERSHYHTKIKQNLL